MAKMKHYIVTVDVAETYEIEIDATSEEKAIKMAEKAIKNQAEDPASRDIDVVDIYESPDESDIED